MEIDSDAVVSEELVEEEESQSDGEQPESDGEDAAAAAVAAAKEEEEEESQGDGEDHESGAGEEFVDAEGALGGAGISEEGSSKPLSPAPSSPHVRVGGTVVEDVIVVDADALECGVCCLPLKPPIFQCERGHVVCSACCDKLKATGKCHVCGVATRGYSRCHAMEHLVASIRIPCPNAAHGCVARPAYHRQDAHNRVCPHAPCRCPGVSCGFIGSTTSLLDHITTVHRWPCTTKVRAGKAFSVRLHDGFNFLCADQTAGDDNQGTISSIPLLYLLNVMQERLGRAISVLRVHPHATSTSSIDNCDDDLPASLTSQCELIFSHYDGSINGALCCRYYQSSEFQVACTDLSNGVPNPDLCFQFIVPNSVLGDDKEGIQV
ncbi:hypothetical protein EJB05_33661 [Eragrostis curvula]|uniref:RING-type E3 ubiquitin transferase n=1 Tax=Eragrostis curvula TaxID=38414 RepID=A0A5J9U1N6_9POAL|nr:hypothetical protein EJB05_33661 [Eragrostis curvula]